MHTKTYIQLMFALLAVISPSVVMAQSINPTATYTDSNGDTATISQGESYTGSAPLSVRFSANKADADGWQEYYEWRVYTESDNSTPLYTRYEENTDFTFTEAGTFRIFLTARFTGSDGTQIEWTESDTQPFVISISESELLMPNAFSPNGDGINDIYKPKSGYKSIVEFTGYIYNRWGKKLFEWHDPATGWDGTYNGKAVKDGVYLCLIKARGADGRKFNIKKTVNLLRGYTESTTVGE